MSDLNQAPNTQQLPAGLGAPAPVAPVPAHNPMLSHVSNPPTVEEALKPVVATPNPAPTIVLPQASTAPRGAAGDLVDGFLGDPQVKLATSYIDSVAADGKLDIQRALGKGFAELDARFIDEAYVKEVLGDKAPNFLETAKSIVNYIQHHRDSVITGVYDAAGGEPQWHQAVDAFKRVASPDEQAMLSGLLDSTDSKQVKYAASRILEIARASGAVIQHSAAVLGKGSSSQGLSAAAYQAELAKYRGVNVPPQKYAELRELRALGKQQGL